MYQIYTGIAAMEFRPPFARTFIRMGGTRTQCRQARPTLHPVEKGIVEAQLDNLIQFLNNEEVAARMIYC